MPCADRTSTARRRASSILLARSSSGVDRGAPPGPRRDLAHARRHRLVGSVVAGAVLRRCDADDLGEPRAERAERGAPDGDARRGDGHALAEQRLGALDAPRHQVGVRRFAVRGTELPREVSRRHQRRARDRGDVERLRVLTIDEIACPAKVRQVGELLRCHAATVPAWPTRPCATSRRSTPSSRRRSRRDCRRATR